MLKPSYSQLQSENAQLKDQVNMLVGASKNYLHDSGITKFNKDKSKVLSCGHGWPCGCSKSILIKAISSLPESALDWRKEVEAWALEEAANNISIMHENALEHPKVALLRMASIKRKGE